jgi:hypothetical protein
VRSRIAIAVTVVLVVAAGIGVGVWSLRAAHPPAAAVAPAAVRPEMVNVSIDSEPRGAEFVLDGAPAIHGRTPFVGQLPRSNQLRTLRLSLPGYDRAVLNVTVHSDLVTQVVLKPATAPREKANF